MILTLILLCAVNINAIKEGEHCVKGSVPGVCTNIRRCPDAQQDIKNRKPPQLCEFIGAEPVVCCISATTTLDVIPEPSSTQAPEDLFCTTESGKPGECVAYYLCDRNNTVNTNGEYIIDIRSRRKRHAKDTRLGETSIVSRRVKRQDKKVEPKPCKSYVHSCCQLPERPQRPITPEPGSFNECGWRHPEEKVPPSHAPHYVENNLWEFPWTVAIFKIAKIVGEPGDRHTDRAFYLYEGGGSIIHPSVVLTAAQLVSTSSRYRVRAGEWNALVEQTSHYKDKDVNGIEIHPKFYIGTLIYDIALLFLAKPMELGPQVGVVCLPPALPRRRVPAGTRCFATGWGKDKFGRDGRYQPFKKVEVPLVDHASCETSLRKTRLGKYFELDSTFICAGGEAGNDTCKGDGGSPLSCPIAKENGRFVQVGIVAWGIGCGEERIPGVYVDVSALRGWIDEKVKAKGYDPDAYTI